MILNRFISYSLIIHLLAMSFLFIAPVKKEQKGRLFFARLIAPEDAGFPLSGSAPLLPSLTKEPPREYSSEQSIPPKLQSKSPQIGNSQIPQSIRNQESGISGQELKNLKDSPPAVTQGTGFPSGIKRENLFDKDVIKKFVEKEKVQKEESTVTFDAKEFKYYGYMERLKEKIEGIWRYPSDAALRGIYGDLYISFTIKKDGSLGSVELLRTSGHRSLDEAAMRALKDAAPYWPLPEEWGRDGFTITGHFIYSLYGTYIR